MTCSTDFTAAWNRILSTYPDAGERLADVELRLPFEAAAIAACERRGDATAWEKAVLDSFAKVDTLRSFRVCGDCGVDDVCTLLPKLTGGRVCARCLREATP